MKMTKKSVVSLCFFLATIAMAFVSSSQEKEAEPVGIFESRAEYNQFMGAVKSAAASDPEMRAMIPILNDIALGQPVGSTARQYNSPASELGLLSNKSVREEIEMVDDQYEELKQLNSGIQSRMAEQVRSLDFGNSEEAVKQVRQMRQASQDELRALLLPHQIERLKQIRMQSLLHRMSLVQVLTNDPIKSDLEITDKQSQDLLATQKEIDRELAEKIAKLRAEAHDKLLARLNPSQQAQAKELIGDAFDLSQIQNAKGNRKMPRDFKGKARSGKSNSGKPK